MRALIFCYPLLLLWACSSEEALRRVEDLAMGQGFGDEALSVEKRALTTCAEGSTLFGIDVSKWQGDIDWDQLPGADVNYAFIRVSDGLTHPDAWFDENWSEARRVGIPRGAYQFFRPGQDAEAQADLLIAAIRAGGSGELPPVVDVEANDGLGAEAVVEQLGRWIARVEAELGLRPIIYTGRPFWRSSLGESTRFNHHPLWIAHYTEAECPNIAGPWQRWAFWQYSSSGQLPGIAGRVDVNRFNGDEVALLALRGAPGALPPAQARCLISSETPVYIEETEPCFERGGPPNYWWSFDGADGEHAYYTYTTDEESFGNFAKFHLDFEEVDLYEFAVFIPGMEGLSRQARYKLWLDDQVHYVTIDQDEHRGGYAILGEFQVSAEGQAVRLDDNTGEAYLNSDSPRLAYDTLRITRKYEMGCPPNSLECTSGGLEQDAGLEPGPQAPVEVEQGTDGGLTPTSAESEGATACHMGHGGAQGLSLLLLMIMMVLALRYQSTQRD